MIKKILCNPITIFIFSILLYIGVSLILARLFHFAPRKKEDKDYKN